MSQSAPGTVKSVNTRLAEELAVAERQVAAAVALLDEGASVPFIARYRKEVTGSLDDGQLRTLEERLNYLRELDQRRDAVLASIGEQGKLTDELKAALLAAMAHERGARIVANELHPHRAELVRGTLNPGDLPDGAAPQAEVTVGDGADLAAERPDAFDRVLVDVPCTGLGALRRRPEARWRRQPADLASLAPTQRSLLHAALDAVRPGGVVAYVTCSPHPAETSVVVDDVRARRDDVELLEVAPVLREVAPATSAADLEPVEAARGARATSVQLWPHVHGTDAMYIALLRRTPQEDA